MNSHPHVSPIEKYIGPIAAAVMLCVLWYTSGKFFASVICTIFSFPLIGGVYAISKHIPKIQRWGPVVFIGLLFWMDHVWDSRHTYVRNSRVGAVCRDGWISSSTGRGTCSHHGGVKKWIREDFTIRRTEEETRSYLLLGYYLLLIPLSGVAIAWCEDRSGRLYPKTDGPQLPK